MPTPPRSIDLRCTPPPPSGSRRRTSGSARLDVSELPEYIELALSLKYGVDYRMVEAAYIGKSIDLGGVGIAFRLLVPCVVGLAMTLALYLFLSRTFYGRAVMGVSQDQVALRLMGANPVRIKTIAFGIGIAAASLSGALLITISPVVPSTDRDYIGRVFAITVLGGLGSIGGTLSRRSFWAWPKA